MYTAAKAGMRQNKKIIKLVINMRIIGLTGGTGSGKSHVGSMLKERHAYIADADVIAHEIIEKEKPAYNELVEHFGKGILDENDDIIRRKLGDIVFSDKNELEFLDECTHKYIVAEIKKLIEEITPQTDKYSIFIIDAPLLAEAGLVDICDSVWVVYADEKVRAERIMKRDGITYEQAEKRIASQKSWEEYKAMGAVIIDNSSDDDNIESQLDALI